MAWRSIALAGGLALTSACNFGSVTAPEPGAVVSTPNVPVVPLPPATDPNETFSGTVADLSGTNVHTFSTTATGDIDVTLADLTPSSARVLVGIGLPNVNGPGCFFETLEVNFVQAGPNLAVPAISHAAGTSCVAVEDQFRLAPFTYTLNVWHK